MITMNSLMAMLREKASESSVANRLVVGYTW